MHRRQLLGAGAAALVSATGLGSAVRASEEPHVPYTRAVYEQALASGEPFMLDFFAPW